MSRRRQGRELVLGCLYAYYSTGEPASTVFEGQSKRVTYDAETLAYARRLFESAIADGEKIDRTIRDLASNWDFGRIALVEKNILRLGIAELWHCLDTPAKVVIDEAVELAKQFGSAKSGRFINGILDAVYKSAETSPTEE